MAVGGDLVQFLDEDGALGLQFLDHGAVVDDLVADVDGLAVAAEGFFHDADRSVDAGAEAAGPRQDDAKVRERRGWA